MNKPFMTAFLVIAVFVGLSAVSGMATGDEYEREDGEHEEREHRRFGRERRADIRPVDNETYRSECGACHMAYQPGLLPARSWLAVMDGLDDHFGDNAELLPETHEQILAYLTQWSADKSPEYRSRRINKSIASHWAPLRVTEVPYFRREHDDLTPRMVKYNDEVRSFGNCAACHRTAEKGIFDEDFVEVPGFKWVD